MKHRNPELDRDHKADLYDVLLRAGICRKCGKPCQYKDDCACGHSFGSHDLTEPDPSPCFDGVTAENSWGTCGCQTYRPQDE